MTDLAIRYMSLPMLDLRNRSDVFHQVVTGHKRPTSFTEHEHTREYTNDLTYWLEQNGWQINATKLWQVYGAKRVCVYGMTPYTKGVDRFTHLQFKEPALKTAWLMNYAFLES